MKAQTVKNAVIVPVGAKGGFVVKRGDVAGRATRRSSAALLELTDNLVDGAGRRRPSGSCGATATTPTWWWRPTRAPARSPTSPTSSPPSAATGSATPSRRAGPPGSTTRRWASRRGARGSRCEAHFRALGVDADTAELTVVGHRRHVGRRVRQRPAAFPTPEAGRRVRPPTRVRRSRSRSGGELRRTAAPVRAADVVVGRLRPGGALTGRRGRTSGRRSRSTLSPEAQRVLGVDDRPLTPDELVSAVLRAPVDLLWNGGIGTFVKAIDGVRTSTSATAPTTPCASTPTELRCRVVAEGGNLGFTQRARVEFALAGGRINTDAIDNSAGRRLLRPRGQHQDPAAARHRRPVSSTPPHATRCSCT